jgi:hypothetical protein
VLHKVTDYCEKTYGISHVTIQVERDIWIYTFIIFLFWFMQYLYW